MNILRVITRMNIGGPAHQVHYLHRALRQCGHEVHLVIGRLDTGEGEAGGELLGRPDVEQIPQLGRPLRPISDAIAFLKIWRLLCREPFQICHSHTAKAGLITRLAALMAKPWRKLKKFPNLKTVHTYHGHVFQGYFSPRMSKWICIAERYLARHTDVLITLTPLLRREISGHLKIPEAQLKVVPLGLDLREYLKVEWNAKDSQPSTVGWVGRFSAIKNPLRFLDLAEILIQLSDRPIAFVMVGDGPLRGHIEAELHRRKLAQAFHLTGWRSDLVAVYRGFEVLINTSDNEGTPVAVLEALCSGLPVAATNVGGTAEILNLPDQPVLCFAKENLVEACEHIYAWIRDGRRVDMNTRQFIAQNFSQEKLLVNLLEIYGDNCSGNAANNCG